MSDVQELYEALKSIFIHLDDGDRRFLDEHALTLSRYYALFHLDSEPGLSFRELSERMLCDKSNVTRVIKILEDDGLVYRQPHETDGRSLRLYLTPAGKAASTRSSAAHVAFNHQRFSFLNSQKQSELLQTLMLVKKNLQLQLQ